MRPGAAPHHAIAVLLELTRELTRQSPLEDALQAVTDAALELLPADHASIRVLDESRSELLCGARSGAGEPHSPASFQPGQGVVGWVVANRKAARIADASRDERFESAATQGWPIRSLLVVPLWSADRVVGALGVSSPQPGVFTAEHEIMALLLANCAAPPLVRVRLERLSVTDAITLAFNARYLQPRLLEEMERATRYGSVLSMASLSLDGFAALRKAHGTEGSDGLLRRFADRVRSAVRRTDALVRKVDAQFVLVMPHTDERQAELVCDRISQSLAELPVVVGEARLSLTASMGIATWNGRESAKQLQARATDALRAAEQSDSQVVVAPTPPSPSGPPQAKSET